MTTLRKQIEDRLFAKVSTYKEVSGAASLSKVQAGRLMSPACYIVSEDESPESNLVVDGVIQHVTKRVAVITSTHNVRSEKGVEGDDENSSLRELNHIELLGWKPIGYSGLTYVSGSLLALSGSFYLYKTVYEAKTTINSI